jgi:hypothetical protein
MFDPASIARAYLETWNETNDEQRRLLYKKYWTKDATYVDPLMQGDGEERIAGMIGAVHQRFPGYRFQQLGTANGYGDYVRLSWGLGPEGSPAPIEGSDVVVVRDGRIGQVIGFIDRAPAAA